MFAMRRRAELVIKQVNVFNQDKRLGNPAAVVQQFNGSVQEKQALAKRINLPVTVFITPFVHSSFIARFEFFAPASELDMCGHGILAGVYHLFSENQEASAKILTKQGEIAIKKRKDGVVQFTSGRAKKIDLIINKLEICQLLNLQDASAFVDNLPFCVASIGSPKLLIPLASRRILNNLQPDFDAIKAWSIQNKVNGLYLYTKDVLDHRSNFHARSFNPKSGNNEDAATGVAAAALASIYAEQIGFNSDVIVEQGYQMNCDSNLVVTVMADKLHVGGHAVSNGLIDLHTPQLTEEVIFRSRL